MPSHFLIKAGDSKTVNEKKFCKKYEENTCFGVPSMLIYMSRLKQDDIRVWRSLVSRLNGVQEAAGSNPVTRTKEERPSTFVDGLLLCLCLCGFREIFMTGNPIITLESKSE